MRGNVIVGNRSGATSGWKGSARPSCKAAMSRLSIPWRLALLVLALAVPLNLIALTVIWGLVDRATNEQRASLLYTARSIAAGVDAKLGKYIALGEALARSPAALDDNLGAFDVEARRQFPAGGRAWVLVADVNGQQLLNTLIQPGEPLPRRNPLGIEAQQRAFATGDIVISDVLRGRVAQDWVVNIEVPIFRQGQPFRVLAVGIRHKEFLPLLSVRDIPRNWLAGIIDGQGRFIGRVPQGDVQAGQLASQGWRATKDRAGVFEFPSLEGDPLIAANAHPSIGGWTVGVAVKKVELRAAAWSTVRWAAFLGAGLSAASLLLAGMLARQITRPIEQLRQSFADISIEPAKPIVMGPPEIMELQDTLYRAAGEQQKASQALMGALAKLEREMDLREEAQAALAKSQRMEAVGQLAGGMAHDFNNVLAAISSHLDMVTLRSTDEKICKAVQGAMDAIEMGASLNRRLLSFSRRSGVGLETIDLNDRVRGTIDLLERTLGDQVTVTWQCSPGPCPILANTGDVDNAILNLAINARDAMPSGGLLTIETRHITLDADAAAGIPNARPGDFVRLTVRDTGQGMTAEVLGRAVEPFFTTKEQGTGLGLATVYGMAQQSNGFVAIHSAVSEGTSVHVYFPKVEAGPTVSRATSATEQAPLGHGERILIVEDNDKVRDAVASRLESLHYAILQARSGFEAIELLESGEPVALVFSDIVLPGGMTGYDIADWVRSKKPQVKVVLTSGYSDVPLASETARRIRVLGKPYTRQQLANALRDALSSQCFPQKGRPGRSFDLVVVSTLLCLGS
jgi:signal transduction histidine kinase/CheY-like chemotaxis protein